MMLVMQHQYGFSVHLCIPVVIPKGDAVNSTNTRTDGGGGKAPLKII